MRRILIVILSLLLAMPTMTAPSYAGERGWDHFRRQSHGDRQYRQQKPRVIIKKQYIYRDSGRRNSNRDWRRYYRRDNGSNAGAIIGGLALGAIIGGAIANAQRYNGPEPTGRVQSGCTWGPEQQDGRFGFCNGQKVFQMNDGSIFQSN